MILDLEDDNSVTVHLTHDEWSAVYVGLDDVLSSISSRDRSILTKDCYDGLTALCGHLDNANRLVRYRSTEGHN